MKNALIFGVLLLIACTGEISVDWGIHWDLITQSNLSFSKMQYEFSAINIDARNNFFYNKIDEQGHLKAIFTVYEYNHKQVEDAFPNVEFKFILSMDTATIIDTVFTWEEMEFEGNVSTKTILLP